MLHIAAEYGHLEAVEFLLKQGADFDYRLQYSKYRSATSLEAAARGGHLDILRLFIEKGAGSKDSAAIIAAEQRKFEALRILLEGGAELDLRHFFSSDGIWWINDSLGGLQDLISRRSMEHRVF